MRRGFRLTPWIVSSEPASSVPATMNGAAEEKSPGISISPSSSRSGRRDRDAARLPRHAHAGLREQVLGVVARRQRLLDRGLTALGVEAGEQHGRLHLCARDGQLVRDRCQRAAFNRERRAAVRRLHGRGHQPQRLGDPLHRPRAERLVAGELEPALLPGEQAGKQAHQRARVAAVERLLRRCQAAQAAAEDAQRLGVGLVDADAEIADRLDRRLGVLGPAEAGDTRLALSHRRQEDGAVRERLVAGDGDVAGDRRGRLDPHDSSSSRTGATTTP